MYESQLQVRKLDDYARGDATNGTGHGTRPPLGESRNLLGSATIQLTTTGRDNRFNNIVNSQGSVISRLKSKDRIVRHNGEEIAELMSDRSHYLGSASWRPLRDEL